MNLEGKEITEGIEQKAVCAESVRQHRLTSQQRIFQLESLQVVKVGISCVSFFRVESGNRSVSCKTCLTEDLVEWKR